MCETCSDNLLNGDEDEVDCGGSKCDACSNEVDEEAENPNNPIPYCNLKNAINFYEPTEDDENHIPEPKNCQFCGNNATE